MSVTFSKIVENSKDIKESFLHSCYIIEKGLQSIMEKESTLCQLDSYTDWVKFFLSVVKDNISNPISLNPYSGYYTQIMPFSIKLFFPNNTFCITIRVANVKGAGIFVYILYIDFLDSESDIIYITEEYDQLMSNNWEFAYSDNKPNS